MDDLGVMIQRSDIVWRRFCKILAGVSAVFLILLTLLVVVDVSLRYLFAKPIPGALESTELLMPWVCLLGLAYTLARGGHVRVTLILDRLPLRLQLWGEVFACVIGLSLCVPLTYYSWLHFWEAFMIREYMDALVKLPWYPAKLAMPIGFFALSVQFMLLLMTLVRSKKEGV
ncbi:TRAP transporter small permease subunit [Chloroflexota bacterium]